MSPWMSCGSNRGKLVVRDGLIRNSVKEYWMTYSVSSGNIVNSGPQAERARFLVSRVPVRFCPEGTDSIGAATSSRRNG